MITYNVWRQISMLYIYIYIFGHMLCVIIYHIMHMLFLRYHEFYGYESYVSMSYVIILVLQMITLPPFYPDTLCDT